MISLYIYRNFLSLGLKLHLENVPVATASTIYHRFFREYQLKDYDPFVSTHHGLLKDYKIFLMFILCYE